MQTQHPTVVRRGFLAVLTFAVVGILLLVGLVASARKTKNEQVAPISNQKVMPARVPVRQDQVVSNKNASLVVVRDQGASFSMLPSSTSAPAPFVSEADLKQKQSVRR